MAHDTLQVEESIGFQRVMWRLQRVGWALMLVVVVAGVAGVFGDGPLAGRTVSTDDGVLTVEYQRIERHRSPASVDLVVHPRDGAETVQVWVLTSYVGELGVDSVHPEPESATAAGDRIEYEFAVDPDERAFRISFRAEPDGIGWKRGEAGIVGGEAVTFRQFILP